MKKFITILAIALLITNVNFNFSMEKPAPGKKEISLWTKFVDSLNVAKARKLIDQYKIDVNAPLEMSDVGQEIPLFFVAPGPIYFGPSESVNQDSIEFIKLLLDHGANPNLKDHIGGTILHELVDLIDQIKQGLVRDESMLLELQDSRKYGTIAEQLAQLNKSIAEGHIQLDGLVNNLKAICSNEKTNLNAKNNNNETALELAKNIEKRNVQYPIYRNLKVGITTFSKVGFGPDIIKILEDCQNSKANSSKG